MDRRVFQPRTDSRAERRRNALRMAILVLAAGWLWLSYVRSHPAVPAVPRQSIPVRAAK